MCLDAKAGGTLAGALGSAEVPAGVFFHELQVGIWCGKVATATATIQISLVTLKRRPLDKPR